jgi:cruciform cutting endonuclease 1
MALRQLPPSYWLDGLKATHLKALAVACGLPSSGTKAALAVRLDTVASYANNWGPATGRRRRCSLLSVDLGVRNLAWAELEFRDRHTAPSSAAAAAEPVTLHVWRRVALVGPGSSSSSSSSRSSPEKEDEDNEAAAAVAVAEEDPDLWRPERMAGLALRVVRDVLQVEQRAPAHVVVERQRFRSGGAAAVQEWTLRVNTLEAMLHATLHTLRALGRWDGQVCSVSPARVAAYWLSEGEAGKREEEERRKGVKGEKRKSKKTGAEEMDEPAAVASKGRTKGREAKAKTKKEKVDLVAKWLMEDKLQLLGTSDVTAKEYLERWEGKRKTSRANMAADSGQKLKKLDDLADCLLQGMAWIRWEENKRILAQEGHVGILGSP